MLLLQEASRSVLKRTSAIRCIPALDMTGATKNAKHFTPRSLSIPTAGIFTLAAAIDPVNWLDGLKIYQINSVPTIP
jgi:hypothetical protein